MGSPSRGLKYQADNPVTAWQHLDPVPVSSNSSSFQPLPWASYPAWGLQLPGKTHIREIKAGPTIP